MSFHIKSSENYHVAGFNSSYQCVQITDDLAHAKVFKTEKSANAFINKYANGGYGLNSDTAIIVRGE
jgi:hypothetical protein